jgi:hypothetical protein
VTCEQRKGGLCFPSAGAFCDFLAAKKLECKDYKKNKREQLKVKKGGGIQDCFCCNSVAAKTRREERQAPLFVSITTSYPIAQHALTATHAVQLCCTSRDLLLQVPSIRKFVVMPH